MHGCGWCAGISTFVIGAVLHVARQTKVSQHHAVHRRHQHVAGRDVSARRQRSDMRDLQLMLPVGLFHACKTKILRDDENTSACSIPFKARPPEAEDHPHRLSHPHCLMLENTREATLCRESCSQGCITTCSCCPSASLCFSISLAPTFLPFWGGGVWEHNQHSKDKRGEQKKTSSRLLTCAQSACSPGRPAPC